MKSFGGLGWRRCSGGHVPENVEFAHFGWQWSGFRGSSKSEMPLLPNSMLAKLLTQQTFGDHEYAPPLDQVILRQLSVADTTSVHSTHQIPDHPPRKGQPPYTRIHQFSSLLSEQCITALRSEIASLRTLDDGISVSNKGGWHSTEEPLCIISNDTITTQSVRFQPLHTHLRRLLSSIINKDAHPQTVSDPIIRPTNATEHFPGHLLLRFQHEPFKQSFTFLPILPTPNSLIAFPGYVPHCVAPRTSDCKSERISIAINVKQNQDDDSEFSLTGWANVNVGDNHNALHDHDEMICALVLYL